jgi:hypothetical protein
VEAILESRVHVRKGKGAQKVSHPADLGLQNNDIGAESAIAGMFIHRYQIEILTLLRLRIPRKSLRLF